MIPPAIAAALEAALGAAFERVRPVGGGCINEAVCGEVAGRPVFVKFNRSSPAGMFAAEAAGLRALRATGTLRVPEPLAWSDSPAFLALEYIHAGSAPSRHVGTLLGRGLATLHRRAQPGYGWDSDNFIGTLRQDNTRRPTWPAFFGELRLAPQLEMAARAGRLSAPEARAAEKLIARLGDLLPADPAPSLLHGDLWGGNYMVDAAGEPVLIDPAVYCGDREVELAFTELFGGFDASFYAAYDEAWPRHAGYAQRRDLYNAYPLLVHVNLFGGGYRGQFMATVARYS